jgi:threonyl-tRNA synthetase
LPILLVFNSNFVLLQPIFFGVLLNMIKITLPDNSVKQYEAGVTPLEIARDISEGLARNVLAAKVNGEVRDATRPLTEDAELQLLTWRDEEGKAAM